MVKKQGNDEKINFCESDIKSFYRYLSHENETEIRLINPNNGRVKKPIFVHSEEEFIQVCKKWNGKYNIYAGINERQKGGTKADDVIFVKTIVIDIDAIRAKGFEKNACTDKELENTEKKVQDVVDEICIKIGSIKPKMAMSGNGFPLYFAIPKIPITDYNREKVSKRLQAFQDEIIDAFSKKGIKIDKIGDLPRIIKVIGTLSIKGQGTKERPHRLSYCCGDFKREQDMKLRDYVLSIKTENPDKNINNKEEKTILHNNSYDLKGDFSVLYKHCSRTR